MLNDGEKGDERYFLPKLSDLNPEAQGKNRFAYPEASGAI